MKNFTRALLILITSPTLSFVHFELNTHLSTVFRLRNAKKMSFFIQKIVEHKEKFNNDELAKIRSWPAQFDFSSGPVRSCPVKLDQSRIGSNSESMTTYDSQRNLSNQKFSFTPLIRLTFRLIRKIYLYLLLLLFYHRTKY